MTLFDLRGRAALITGAAGGIGQGLAMGLAQAGADVVLNGRDVGRLEACAAAIRAGQPGARVTVIPFDVTDEHGIEAGFQALSQQGIHVDILVNNAGIQVRQAMLTLGRADWQRVIDTNLTSAFLVARAAVTRMRDRGRGKIINVTSLTGEVTRANVAPYTAAKGGLKMLTKAMAAEWAGMGIQVNAIGPGHIATEMTRLTQADPAFDAWVKAGTPQGRWGTPQDLVGAAIFLASSASDFVNGQTIYVDGGFLAVM